MKTKIIGLIVLGFVLVLGSLIFIGSPNGNNLPVPIIQDDAPTVTIAPPSLAVTTQEQRDNVIQKLEEDLLFYGMEGIRFTVTEDMLTSESLENCAKLWKDVVQKTTSVRTGDPRTMGDAMQVQQKFKESSCAGTQDEWKK